MIVKKDNSGIDSKHKALRIELSNGDDIRIYDDGNGYCYIGIDRHEDFVEKAGNKSTVDFTTKEVPIARERICKAKEIEICEQEKPNSTMTKVSLRHFQWK